MRYILISAFILSIITFVTSCKNSVGTEEPEPKPVLEIEISEQPEGGTNINKVTIQFKIFASDEISQPITVIKQWHWNINGQKDSSETSSIVKSNYTLVRATFSDTQEKEFLEGSYWFKIIWEDGEGAHTLVSDTVKCVINDN